METTFLIIRIVCSVDSLICSVYVVLQLHKINKHLEFQEIEERIKIDEQTFRYVKNPRKKDRNGNMLLLNDEVYYRGKLNKVVVHGLPNDDAEYFLNNFLNSPLKNIPSEELIKNN